MPRPRIARRLWKQSSAAESWAYLGAELGGNTWAITTATGRPEELSLRSIDLRAGVETIRAGNRGWFAETGYAFARKLQYEAGGQTLDLADAWFLRGGVQF